jgi:hypothetical protein
MSFRKFIKEDVVKPTDSVRLHGKYSIKRYLKIAARKFSDDLHFENNDLIYLDTTIVSGALTSKKLTIQDLLDVIFKIKP